MNTTTTRLPVLSWCAVMLILSSSTVHGVPLGWTLSSLGGHGVVEDPNGNRWLSPTATQGLSVNDAAASTFATEEGFGVVPSIIDLLVAYGLPTSTTPDNNNSGGWDGFDFEFAFGGPAKSFILDFGTTLIANDPANSNFLSLSFGWLASNTGGIGRTYVGLLNTNGTDFGGVLVQSDLPGGNRDLAGLDHGTWMFKAAAQAGVPSPAPWLLVVPGLILLHLARRRA